MTGTDQHTMLTPVLAWIDQHREEAIADLQRFCRQPSVAAQNWGMQEMATIVQTALEQLGAATQPIPTPGYPIIVGNIPGTHSRRLLIYDHYDVQPAEPLDDWVTPPFDATIRDNILYARGVADNKGNLVARLWAARAWLATHGTLPCHVTFVVEGEEEIGSPNLEQFAATHQDIVKADACLWESGHRDSDDALTISAGAKGILYVELRVRTVAYDLHSSNAPIAPNAAWRLHEVLGTLRNTSGYVLLPHFYDAVLLPNAREQELLKQFPIDVAAYKQQWNTEYLLGISEDATYLTERLLYEPTCNICGLWSGYSGSGSKTILPAEAGAKIDFRLVPDQDPDTILHLLREHLHEQGFDDVEVIQLEMGERPAQSPVDTPIITALVRSAHATYGIPPKLLPRSPGTGPMELLCLRYNVPVGNGAGIGNNNSRIHAPNENVRIEDFLLGIKHIATLLAEFGTE